MNESVPSPNKNQEKTDNNLLRQEITQLQNENQILRMKNRALILKSNFSEENSLIIKNLEKKLIKAEEDKLENGEEKLKAVLQKVREIILGLSPMDLYYKLKDLPEKQLKLNEFLLINVVELVDPYKKESNAIRLENTALKEEIKFKNEKLKQNLQEIEHMEKLLREKESSFKKIERRQEMGSENLHLELDKAYEEIKQQREKMIKNEECLKENRKLKEDIEILNHKVKIFKNQQEEIEEPKNGKISEYSEIEILKKEKEFILKENLRLLEEVKSDKQKMRELQIDTKESKEKYEKLFSEMIENQKIISSNYEKRIEENFESNKKKQQNELDQLKNNLSTLYEKQISFLREQKESVQFELVELKNEIKEKNRQIEQLLEENKNLYGKMEGEYCEIKISYKMKSEELEKKTIELENLKIYKNNSEQENIMLREKLELLKTEIFKVKSQSNEEVSLIRAENLMLRRELDSYNQIEKEIDQGIISTFKNNKEDGFLETLNSIPTSKNKRILQAIQLGKKLTEKQQEVNELLKEKEKLENSLRDVEREYQGVKEVIEKSKQPGNYLVRTIEEKEKEIVALKKEIYYKQKENANLKSKLEIMNEKYQESLDSLRKIESKKVEVDGIKKMLMKLTEEDLNNPYLENFILKQNLEKERPERDLEKTLEVSKNPQWVKKLGKKQAKFSKKQLI